MTSPGIDGPLTETELNIIQQSAIEYRGGLNIDFISDLVQAGSKNLRRLLNQDITDMSPEERMAVQILMAREESYDKEYLTKSHFLMLEKMINLGAKSIREYGDYCRFEPCIEKIFMLSFEELDTMADYITEFEQSDYSTTSEQYKHELQEYQNNIHLVNQTGEKVSIILDMYKSMVGLFERTFPNLLALKRTLDGENPSVENLQNKRFSSVCRELVNTEDEHNSVYFDLIVKKYDRNLRNGLSHGDIINDTLEEEVRIPSTGRCYSYTEIGDIGERNLSNAYFLTGFYRGLIEWRFNTYDIEDITRERLDI